MEDDYNRSNEIWVVKFDEESAQKFRDAVISQSRNDLRRPITIYIDSYGGSIDALSKMIETIDEIPNTVVTVCMGKAMSAGAVLLSHGDIRFCGKHSRVMIHEVSSGTSGDVHDMHADVEETKRLNQYFLGLLAKNCGFKGYQDIRKLIKDQEGRDRYMDAQTAVDFGIVDAVGLPKVSHNLAYEVNIAKEKAKFEKYNKNSSVKKKTKTKSDNKKK
jgi:ATP-dependent Clp protease protease subunit